MSKHNKLYILMALCFLTLPVTSMAQPGTNMPSLLDCGQQGDAELICGTRAPEDFEVTPDGKYLLVANFGQGEDVPIDLFNLKTQEFTEITISSEPLSGWGVSACTDTIGYDVSPHGLSLSQRSGGEWQFYVVNHNIRESMEMYELVADGDTWSLVWRGCAFAQEPYNDVSTLPDGSFVATRPQAIETQGQDIFAGAPSGNVARWNSSEGETVLPDSEYAYPNGVLVSEDGRYVYISAWTSSSFHKYDLLTNQEIDSIDLGFMPDNLTWTPDGNILAAGIKGVAGNCPADSNISCIVAFRVDEVNPDTLAVESVYDSGARALISGTSVAIEAAANVYVGSFQGTRMVKIPRIKTE